MDNTERKYRFSEIMSAVSLLPDMSPKGTATPDELEELEGWVLPNLTNGISDDKMKDAILCQAFKGDEEFKFKLVALLSNSAMKNISEARQQDTKPTDDDLTALSISANILWAEGQGTGLFQLLGLIGQICTSFDMPIPSLATLFLRTQEGIERYGKLDPYAILEGQVAYKHVREALSEGE
jgi:hypothetical protein